MCLFGLDFIFVFLYVSHEKNVIDSKICFFFFYFVQFIFLNKIEWFKQILKGEIILMRHVILLGFLEMKVYFCFFFAEKDLFQSF